LLIEGVARACAIVLDDDWPGDEDSPQPASKAPAMQQIPANAVSFLSMGGFLLTGITIQPLDK
jgi:hypothetical protein